MAFVIVVMDIVPPRPELEDHIHRLVLDVILSNHHHQLKYLKLWRFGSAQPTYSRGLYCLLQRRLTLPDSVDHRYATPYFAVGIKFVL